MYYLLLYLQIVLTIFEAMASEAIHRSSPEGRAFPIVCFPIGNFLLLKPL